MLLIVIPLEFDQKKKIYLAAGAFYQCIIAGTVIMNYHFKWYKNSKIRVLANLNITKGKITIDCYTIDWLVIRIGTGLIIFYS